jgi:ribosomal protein S11
MTAPLEDSERHSARRIDASASADAITSGSEQGNVCCCASAGRTVEAMRRDSTCYGVQIFPVTEDVTCDSGLMNPVT